MRVCASSHTRVDTCTHIQVHAHACAYPHPHAHMYTHPPTLPPHHTCMCMRAHMHTHTQDTCMSYDQSLKYTHTTSQPPATSNLFILRPNTNFITIFCHLVGLSCIICSVLNHFFSLSPHTTEKAHCWPIIVLLYYPTQIPTINSN